MGTVSIFRRVTMWSEAAVAVGLIPLGGYCVEEADRFGATRYLGVGSMVILFALFLVGALAFGLGAVTLRPTSRLGWYGQVFPLAAVALLIGSLTFR